MPFDVTCRLLGAFGQIAELRADAMRWIVQVHEGLNCWGELTRAHPALLFHVRDPVLTRDASYALLRVCQAHSASADGGGRALLSTWELGRVHRLAKTLERPPPALSAIVAHQVNGRCDELTQAICTSAPFHDVNGLADYWHNVHPDSIDALAASDAFADEAVGLDRHWTAELQGRLKANGATDAQGGEADGEGGRSASAARGSDKAAAAAKARAGRHRPTDAATAELGAKSLLEAAFLVGGGLASHRAIASDTPCNVVHRQLCRSWSHVVHSRAAPHAAGARGRPPGIAGRPLRGAVASEKALSEALRDAHTRRPALAGAARTAFAVGVSPRAAEEWLASPAGWGALTLAEQHDGFAAALLLIAHMGVARSMTGLADDARSGPGVAPRAIQAVCETVLALDDDPRVAGEGGASACAIGLAGALRELTVRVLRRKAVLLQDVDALEEVRATVRAMDEQLMGLMECFPASRALHLLSIDLFAVVSGFHREHQMPYAIVPSARHLQHCILAPCPLVTSALCGMLLLYRDEIEALRASSTRGTSIDNGLSQITQYNAVILDVCNALWRQRAFTPAAAADEDGEGEPKQARAKGSATFLAFPKPHIEALAKELGAFQAQGESNAEVGLYVLRRTLSITWGAPWQGHVRAFLSANKVAVDASEGDAAGARAVAVARALEDVAVKIAYLNHLKEQGLVGLHAFMHAFLSSLAKPKDKKTASAAKGGKR